MKFLIHSNAPQVQTGYGIQTALLALRLKAAGHEVAVSANAGQEFTVGMWNGIPVYPRGYAEGSSDTIVANAEHWFKGDKKAGWIITLLDVFVIDNPRLHEWQVAAWVPVDHSPVPPRVAGFLAETGARPIAMSKFGEDELRLLGFDPMYVPLAFDPNIYKPTETIDRNGRTFTGRELMGGIDDDKFVVMMNFQNKALAYYDRKGVATAFFAFGTFAAQHPDAVLYLNTDRTGRLGGTFPDLMALATAAAIPPHQIQFVDQYAYGSLGITPEMLAATYTAADVLLAPSMGEGFCVPLIEAQACGTPVIVSNFSSQPELVGAGWLVGGQRAFNIGQNSRIFTPYEFDVVARLEAAYEARHNPTEHAELTESAIAFAAQYEADRVFSEHWQPVLDELTYRPPPLELDRTQSFEVAVLVPTLNRPQNVLPLVESFRAANDRTAKLYLIVQKNDEAQAAAALKVAHPRYPDVAVIYVDDDCTTFAQKINEGFRQTAEPFVFLSGDDVDFQPGWLQAAAQHADTFDVIGTNDGGMNKLVAAGVHADHFFVRRAYVDRYGASLGGPGEVCHEGYRHFYVDCEIVELAKARNVFTPCLESLVVHNRIRTPDTTDELAAGHFDEDGKRWQRRKVLMVAKTEHGAAA